MGEEHQSGDATRDATAGAPKRAYSTPKLIEYGSVAKLTRGTRSVQADATGGGFAKKTCL